MSSWQPTEQGLKDLLQLLHEAMHPTSGQTVQEVMKEKKAFCPLYRARVPPISLAKLKLYTETRLL